jgi:hypothetical protein
VAITVDAATDTVHAPVRTRALIPGWHLLALVAGIGSVALTAGPIRDPDVFWHTLVGEYFLHGKAFPHPDPWAFTLPSAHWHSTSWLGEIVLAATYDAGGYAGIVALRLVMALAVVAALFLLLVRGRSGWAGAVVFVLLAIPLTDYVQERPQTVSVIFCCWLAHRVRQFLLYDELPARGRFVAITYLWATVHGLFVLAPALLVLLAAGAALDGYRARAVQVRSLLLTAALATVLCAATPMGPRLLLAPITVGSSARGFIAEWFPTQLTTLGAWAFASMLGLLLLTWARSTERTPRAQLLLVLVLAGFGFSATRNAGPAAVLLAPLAVDAAERTWHARSSTLLLPRTPVLAVSAVALLAALVSYLGHPLVATTAPSRIAAELRHEPGNVRLLNDYNVSGYLLRESWPHIRVTIDGRADRYGHAALQAYSDAMKGDPSWRRYVAALDVDEAVLRKEQALTQLLLTNGWHQVMTDGPWVLLRRDGTP